LSWSGTLSGDQDHWDVYELDDGIDDEDSLMEPGSKPAAEALTLDDIPESIADGIRYADDWFKPALEAVTAELKQQCIKMIKDKFTAFLDLRRDAWIERARTLERREIV
jgi:hypothetical protein